VNEVYPFNLNHLRYFYEVARAGNMRRAATRIGISQPALSKQIQALEDAIDLQLFYRSSKGLQPTPDGDIVYAHCERVFGHLRDLEEAIDALRTGTAGRVTIGAIYSISVHLLPDYIRRYRDESPKVRMKIITSRSAQVLQALREHRVDIGFVAGMPDDDTFEAIRFRDNPLVPVAHPTHPLFAQAKAQGGQLEGENLDRVDMVGFDDAAPTRHLIEKYLDLREAEPRVATECPSIETIKRLVLAGIGFSVLPQHSVDAELAEGKLAILPIRDWDLSRDLYLVHLARPPLSPTVRRFVDLIKPI
jgi:DNA-binding transcriptional LysR family regulator